MLTNVTLHGTMGRKFGRNWKLDVNTPAEALRALFANCPLMPSWLRERQDKPFQVFVGDRDVTEQGLQLPHGGADLRIVPIIGGAKERGAGQVIAGVVLIVVATIINFVTAGSAGGATTFMYKLGFALILGGVAQMMFSPPTPQASPDEREANTASYLFTGPVNTTAQGHPVPVGYGRLRVGGAVINAGIVTEEYAAGGGTTDAWAGTSGGTPKTTFHVDPS